MAASAAELVGVLDRIDVPDDRGSRLALRAAAARLQARLLTPNESINILCNNNAALHAILHTTIDMGLWPAWANDGRAQLGVEDLAKIVPGGCDVDLLRRLLRLLAAREVVLEVAEDTWERTPLTEALGDPDSGPSSFVKWCEYSHPPNNALPAFLHSTSYKSAGDLSHNAFTAHRPDNATFFGLAYAEPEGFGKVFKTFMRGMTATKTPWTEIFDTSTLFEGAEGDAPLLVDVGGGLGTDIKHFLAKHSGDEVQEGKIVLQDQPSVLSSPGMDALDPERKRVRTMVHDFFAPQPIVGARAYFFHAVLHDWTDEDALRILQHIAAAMQKGYSKLLLYETCLPPRGASAVQAGMDIRMMVMLGAKERTEAMWRALLRDAGLSLVKVWGQEAGWESVVEAELA